MENNNLKKVLQDSMGGYYKASNKLTVYTLSPYIILNFDDLNNGDKLKRKIENKCYQDNYKLSNKIIASEEKFENNALFDKHLFSGMSIDNITSLKSYEAFADENILTDLYSIEINNDRSILKFVNKYGLLEADKPFKSTYYNGILMPGQNISPIFEDYSKLIKAIDVLQSLIDLWVAYQNNKIEVNHLRPLFIPLQKNDNISEAPKSTYKTIAETLIRAHCNYGLKTVSPVLKTNNEFEVNYTSTNLLGVLYVQLHKIILNQRNSYNCKYCGKLNFYNTNNKSNNFCQPPPGIKGHSECNNSYNNMRRLARYKIIDNKYDFDQIKKYAKTIKWTDFKDEDRKGRELNEVLKWIINYNPRAGKWKNALKKYKKNKPKTFKKIEQHLTNK